MTSPYLQSKDLGYSDEDLIEHFSKRDPEFKKKYDRAIELKHSPEEIFTRAHASYKKQKIQNQPEVPQENEENEIDREVERAGARLTSRGIEQVLGAPGNIRDFAKSIKQTYQENKPKSILGIKVPDVQEPKEMSKIDESIGNTVSNLIGYLPTSKDLKKFSEEKSRGYTSPKNEAEKIGDEVFENIVASALPGQGKRNVWRNIAAPIVGVLGKEAVKYVGGEEKSQALTQLGLNLAIPLMSGNAPKLNKDTWKNVQKNVPPVNIQTQDLVKRAEKLKDKISKGLGAKSENQATTTLNKLMEKLDKGHISADELMASNISLNEIIGDPELFGKGRHLFEEMRGIIRDGMKSVGKQSPEWYKEWQKANEIHGAIANSNYIAKTIRNHAEPLVSEGARALFHAAAYGTAKAAGAIPPIYLIYKGTQVMNRMANSPHLLNYYTNVMTNALRGNVALMASNLEKLDEGLLKEERKENPPFKTSSPKK